MPVRATCVCACVCACVLGVLARPDRGDGHRVRVRRVDVDPHVCGTVTAAASDRLRAGLGDKETCTSSDCHQFAARFKRKSWVRLLGGTPDAGQCVRRQRLSLLAFACDWDYRTLALPHLACASQRPQHYFGAWPMRFSSIASPPAAVVVWVDDDAAGSACEGYPL